MELKQNTKLETENDSTDKKFENNDIEEEIKTEESAEVVDENLKSFSISTKLETENDSTDKKFENNDIEEEIKTEESAEVVDENRKSLSISTKLETENDSTDKEFENNDIEEEIKTEESTEVVDENRKSFSISTKLETENDSTDDEFEKNDIEEEIKTEESAELVDENRKSFSISSLKNSLVTSEESLKDLRCTSENIREQPLNSEDTIYSDTASMRKELFDAILSRPLNRLDVIESCRSITMERKQLILKNILLQKKLHDYFKKKKAEGMYVEGNSIVDGLEESQADLLYRKYLSNFEDVLEKSTSEKAKMDLKSKELFQRWDESINIAAEEVDSLLKAEEMYGNGLVKCSSGKILHEKEVFFLVNRHKEVIADLTLVLLKYIRVRDALSEKEAALKSLEDLGDGLSLINYELLYMEKLDMQNRIEERNAVLDHFKGKIEAALVTLSHFKEKISSCAEMIEINLQQLDESEYLLLMNQDKRALAKKQNIELREEIKILQHEAGLLVNHSLLRDFDNAALQVDEVKREVDELKKLQSKKDKRLTEKSNVNCTSFRSNYSSIQKTSNDTSEENNLKKQSQKQAGLYNGKICKGRPSIDKIFQK